MPKGLIAVSGNIATGKTTLTRLLATTLSCECELESVNDNPYLADFYTDMKSWSLPLQLYFLGRRAIQHERAAANGSCAILDRSIYEDASIFAELLHAQGHIADREFLVYRQLFDFVTGKLKPLDLIIYLRARPEVLLQRIRARGRVYERTITLEYIQQIDSFYERWIASIDQIPTIKIDTSNFDFRQTGLLSQVTAMVLQAIKSRNIAAPV